MLSYMDLVAITQAPSVEKSPKFLLLDTTMGHVGLGEETGLAGGHKLHLIVAGGIEVTQQAEGVRLHR